MITAEDWRIITQYRETVIALGVIKMEIDTWEKRGYPVPHLIDQAHRLNQEILRFLEIVKQIPDRTARIVINCRYVEGLTIAETAEYMNISHGTVDNIIKKLKPSAAAQG